MGSRKEKAHPTDFLVSSNPGMEVAMLEMLTLAKSKEDSL